jgi:hypothetical protein
MMCGAARGDDSELLRLIPGSDDDVSSSGVSPNTSALVAGGASRAFVTFKSFAAATTARQVQQLCTITMH